MLGVIVSAVERQHTDLGPSPPDGLRPSPNVITLFDSRLARMAVPIVLPTEVMNKRICHDLEHRAYQGRSGPWGASVGDALQDRAGRDWLGGLEAAH